MDKETENRVRQASGGCNGAGNPNPNPNQNPNSTREQDPSSRPARLSTGNRPRIWDTKSREWEYITETDLVALSEANGSARGHGLSSWHYNAQSVSYYVDVHEVPSEVTVVIKIREYN